MKTQKTHNLPLLILAATLCLPGCKNKDEPQTTPPAASTAAPSEEKQVDDETNKAQIHISPKVQELCGISSDQAKFEFDSAKLSGGAKKTLDALAKCFLTGPGVGKNLNLVGHADPRGTEDYNFALGQKRAGNVGKYLSGKGLKGDRVESSSRGELDATGTSESSWAQDRRVDILLAE